MSTATDAHEQPVAPAPDVAPMEQRVPDRPLASLPRRIATSGWLLALCWLVTRAWTFRRWVLHFTGISGDPRYYDRQLSIPGIDNQLHEYPVPVVWVLRLVRWCAAGQTDYFVAALAVVMALLDLGFTLLLWQQAHRRAAWYWTLFTTCMGSLLWFRFDVLPAVIVGAALLLMIRSPRASGALVGLGTAIKLWPALVVLPLISRDRDGRRRVAGFAGTGAVIALLALAEAGWTRLVSPLTWQGDRGLQVESFTAGILAFLDSRDAQPRWSIELTPFNAYEIFGPHVDTMLQVSSLLMVAAGLLALALGLRAWQRGTALDPYLAAMSTVAVIAAFITANKTFSPQYMFWLGAPLAVLVSQARTTTEQARAAVLCLEGLVAAVLTQVVYPDHYSQLIFGTHPDISIALALGARNLLCLMITLQAGLWSLLPGRRDHGA